MSLPYGTYSQSLTSSVSNPNPEPITVWDIGEEACKFLRAAFVLVYFSHVLTLVLLRVVAGNQGTELALGASAAGPVPPPSCA